MRTMVMVDEVEEAEGEAEDDGEGAEAADRGVNVAEVTIKGKVVTRYFLAVWRMLNTRIYTQVLEWPFHDRRVQPGHPLNISRI